MKEKHLEFNLKSWYRFDIKVMDLFAGPGRYDDGTQSTPIKILYTSSIRYNEASTLAPISGFDQAG